jgi:alpha-ketoglutarate-dependent taurine dioxygenase
MDSLPFAEIADPRIETSRRWPVTQPFDAVITGRTAWRRADVAEADWKLPIPPAALAEIEAVVQSLRAHPVPTLLLTPGDFALDACRALMARVKAVLRDGVGFAVLDRLPVERFSKPESTAIYWLLSQLIERPVAQAYQGTMLYDVWDTGLDTGPRTRADLTNDDLSWHTDYGFNHPPPHLGLLVLATARSGGESGVASLHTGHNLLRERHPDLLARLYRPYVWNRQGEHPEADPICTSNPIFTVTDGQVRARYNRGLQPIGYRLVDREIDAPGMAALNTLHDILSEPENQVEFVLAPGQIEYANNARVAHRRTTFEDWPEPARRRHLVRIFLRDEGRRSYMG